MSGAAFDRFAMDQALALAALAEGRTAPNPRVGCVLARDGAIVGTGFHPAAGEPHAEATALREAGERSRGATLYVNLEPCAHHGRTPPCTDLVATSGVARVVASLRDPDPRVDGRGFERLRAAGVLVEVGLRESEARRLNAAFLHLHATGRPRVTLKAAVSADGRIAARGGSSTWITGEPARRFAHRLRLRHDAVLVGAGTARHDDPRLDPRLPGVDARRIRAVLAPRLDLDPAGRLFRVPGPPPRVYVAPDVPASRVAAFEGRATVVPVPSGERGLDLAAVLEDLRALGVQSVLVEGGGLTTAAFLEAGLADDAALFVAPGLLGSRGATPWIDGEAPPEPSAAPRLAEVRRFPLGRDLVVLGRIVKGSACSPA